uniref:Uncharacterized protein n=1 Tax=Arundo donax TaxID=35708 RepID=A0A0A9FCG0_ARUDO
MHMHIPIPANFAWLCMQLINKCQPLLACTRNIKIQLY